MNLAQVLSSSSSVPDIVVSLRDYLAQSKGSSGNDGDKLDNETCSKLCALLVQETTQGNYEHALEFLQCLEVLLDDDSGQQLQVALSSNIVATFATVYEKIKDDASPGAVALLSDLFSCLEDLCQAKTGQIEVGRCLSQELMRWAIGGVSRADRTTEDVVQLRWKAVGALNALLARCKENHQRIRSCGDYRSNLLRLCQELKTMDDYPTQVLLLEVVYRIARSETEDTLAPAFGDLTFAQQFKRIKSQTFVQNGRDFLCFLNSMQGEKQIIHTFQVKKLSLNGVGFGPLHLYFGVRDFVFWISPTASSSPELFDEDDDSILIRIRYSDIQSLQLHVKCLNIVTTDVEVLPEVKPKQGKNEIKLELASPALQTIQRFIFPRIQESTKGKAKIVIRRKASCAILPQLPFQTVPSSPSSSGQRTHASPSYPPTQLIVIEDVEQQQQQQEQIREGIVDDMETTQKEKEDDHCSPKRHHTNCDDVDDNNDDENDNDNHVQTQRTDGKGDEGENVVERGAEDKFEKVQQKRRKLSSRDVTQQSSTRSATRSASIATAASTTNEKALTSRRKTQRKKGSSPRPSPRNASMKRDEAMWKTHESRSSFSSNKNMASRRSAADERSMDHTCYFGEDERDAMRAFASSTSLSSQVSFYKGFSAEDGLGDICSLMQTLHEKIDQKAATNIHKLSIMSEEAAEKIERDMNQLQTKIRTAREKVASERTVALAKTTAAMKENKKRWQAAWAQFAQVQETLERHKQEHQDLWRQFTREREDFTKQMEHIERRSEQAFEALLQRAREEQEALQQKALQVKRDNSMLQTFSKGLMVNNLFAKEQ
ncbi:Synaptonemal complex protein 2-like [Balamuthia mandrillaris]